MTKKQINEIKARSETATPAPWDYDGMHNEIHCEDELFLIISELRTHPNEKIIDECGHKYNPNFEFIAHSREDIPALLEYIEQLQAEHRIGVNAGADAIKQLKSENVELQARLDKAVELPCKIGDKLYAGTFRLHEWEITEIDIYDTTTIFRLGNKGTDNYAACHIFEIGDRYFLTREEAEKALKDGDCVCGLKE